MQAVDSRLYSDWSLRSDDKWHPSLVSLNRGRAPFRPATAKVVKGILRRYTKPEDRILEIGSGLGELVTLAPEYKRRVQQTEIGIEKSKLHAKELNGSNVISADAYSLPFKDGSYNAVVANSVFDTLVDVEKATREVNRVLASGGRFMHFLDLGADPCVIINKIKRTGFVPFPAIAEDNHTGLRLVPVDEAKETIAKMELINKIYLNLYVMDPYGTYKWLASQEALDVVEPSAKQHFPDAEVICVNDFFLQDFRTALSASGLDIVHSTRETGVEIIQRRAHHRTGRNIFHSNLGADSSGFEQDILEHYGRNRVEVASTVQVLVSMKR